MRTIMKIVLVIAVILVLIGIYGTYYSKDHSISNHKNSYFGGMMFGDYDDNINNSAEKIDLGTLKNKVDEYIESYDEKLIISDIFIFEDSDYYFSILEEETGIGAMELLVNPYTGNVYPEFGPNMMWNKKYGMHNNSRCGMMGRGSMMSNYYNNDFLSNSQYSKRNEILLKDAYDFAKEYIEKKSSNTQTVTLGGHEFYGYYTFHIEKDDAIIGMLSVSGYTGKVWYHDWHGTVSEIIDTHDSSENHS